MRRFSVLTSDRSSGAATLILIFCLVAAPVLANGAAAEPGTAGHELLTEKGKLSLGLAVDQTVTLNAHRKTVTVEYRIENPSKKPLSMDLLFPLPRLRTLTTQISGQSRQAPSTALTERDLGDCEPQTQRESADAGAVEKDRYLDFHVTLDGSELPLTPVPLSGVQLSEAYVRLRTTSCGFYRFPVALAPGRHVLFVTYAMRPAWEAADGDGEAFEYEYEIWPASNWVQRFGASEYRFVPPGGDLVPWLGRFTDDWVERTLIVEGPGAPIYRPAELIFRQEGFVPAGRLHLRVESHPTIYGVSECPWPESQQGPPTGEVLRCWRSALREMVAVRPYRGATRRYNSRDLSLVPLDKNGGVERPFAFLREGFVLLRNEIYARRGRRFEGAALQEFFAAMPWYAPRDSVEELTPVEQQNVRLLLFLERAELRGFEEGTLSEQIKRFERLEQHDAKAKPR